VVNFFDTVKSKNYLREEEGDLPSSATIKRVIGIEEIRLGGTLIVRVKRV